MVNGIMLRGFSFPTAERLADVSFIDPASRTANGVNRQMFGMDFEEYLPAQKSFELMTAYLNGSTVNMTVDGQARRYTGAYTTDTFLRVLGMKPAMGRDFTAEDNRPGAEKVAHHRPRHLAARFRRRQRHRRPRHPAERQARDDHRRDAAGIRVPGERTALDPALQRVSRSGRGTTRRRTTRRVMGVLKPGVSMEQAEVEFTGFAKRFAAAYPDTNKAFNTAEVRSLIDQFTGPQLRGMMWTMLAFCVGVLLIACVNVMNMQFARATLRARELAVRSSLGATRSRLIRQMLTESSLLAGAGAILGIGLAYFSTGWLEATIRNLENPPPSWMTFTLDVPACCSPSSRRSRPRSCRASCRRGWRRGRGWWTCCARAGAATPAAGSAWSRADW